MKKTFYVLAVVLFTFVACTKEEVTLEKNSITALENASSTELDGVTAPAARLRLPKCELEDYYCDGGTYQAVLDFCGDTSVGVNERDGIFDKYINCPPVALENCDRTCPTITKRYMFGAEPITIWYENNDDPCGSDNVYTAAEQLAFINTVKQLAIDDAPLCNGQKMTASYYNVLWDFIVFGDFYISVDVTYISPCLALDQ